MSGWAEPRVVPGVSLPPWLKIAGMGRRVGAWILDLIFLGILALIPFTFAIVSGAVSLNDEALRQLQDNYGASLSDVTVPLLKVDQGLLMIALAMYLVIAALYFVGGWVWLRGTPGQRLLSLQVADVATGRNLTFAQAVIRWLVLQGIASIVGFVPLVMMLNDWATTPASQIYASSSVGLSGLLSYGPTLWQLVLLVTTGVHPARRGWHDRIAGSVVVGRADLVPAWPGYGYGQPPLVGYPPAPPYGTPPYGTPPYGTPPSYGQPPADPGSAAGQGSPGQGSADQRPSGPGSAPPAQ
ncbi:MAG: RDD family protein [Candidatus Limnocylindrales bacterium]